MNRSQCKPGGGFKPKPQQPPKPSNQAPQTKSKVLLNKNAKNKSKDGKGQTDKKENKFNPSLSKTLFTGLGSYYGYQFGNRIAPIIETILYPPLPFMYKPTSDERSMVRAAVPLTSIGLGAVLGYNFADKNFSKTPPNASYAGSLASAAAAAALNFAPGVPPIIKSLLILLSNQLGRYASGAGNVTTREAGITVTANLISNMINREIKKTGNAFGENAKYYNDIMTIVTAALSAYR